VWPCGSVTDRGSPEEPRSVAFVAWSRRCASVVAASALIGAGGCGSAGGVAMESGAGPEDRAPDLSDVAFAPELAIDLGDFELRPSGLYVQDVVVGSGPVARRTSRVWVRYVGRLADGTVFDGNLGGQPYAARLGGSEVIRGWNEGITGMRRGGIRRLVVPPHLGYGSRGRGDVPPRATMIFDLELVDVD
jgi:hypothetical protein